MKRDYEISFICFGHNSYRAYRELIENVSNIYKKVKVYDFQIDPYDRKHFSKLISNRDKFWLFSKIEDLYSRILRYIKYIINLIKFISESQSDLFYVFNFKGAFLIPILFWKKKFVLALDTTSVYTNIVKRIWQDIFYYGLNSHFYKNIIANNQYIVERYKIQGKNIHLTKWGFKAIDYRERTFDRLSLIYLGTLTSRKLYKTILGFKRFNDDYKDRITIQYAIIGEGNRKDVEELKNTINGLGLEKTVNYLGPLPDCDLGKNFKNANVGVAFVPITKYFNHQTVTKTYEYLLSGMPVVATKTLRNQEVIDENNGVLIEDNQDSFYKGLVEIYNNLPKYNSFIISNSANKYRMDSEINSFNEYFDSIILS